MQCADLCQRLDAELDTAAYADVDASANGLQVGPADVSVEHVALAVDAAQATIDEASAAGADLLVAHHGLSWDGIERITGTTYQRVAPLIDDELALYVSHLPLDGHQSYGNAAGLANLLDLGNRAPFGQIGGEYIGQRGHLPGQVGVEALRERLDDELDTGGQPVRSLDFGPAEVKNVAIVTGSGADYLEDAVASGADLFLTGEGKHQLYHEAREAGMNVLLAGHYATETFGVKSLQSLLEEWGLETTFIDHPTGL